MTPSADYAAFVAGKVSGYRVIVADPPWAYRNFSDSAHGAAIHHYHTMSFEAMAEIPVASFAAEDAVLAMWATWPKLDEAIALLRAWGFKYVTGLPWVKTNPGAGEIRRGIGFWTMSASELVLIGTQGEPKRGKGALGGMGTTKVIGLLVGEPRVFYAPIRGHSSKPEEMQDWLAGQFPGPYLELFARRERPGWVCWGTDLGFKLSATGVAPCEPPHEALPLFDGAQPTLFGEAGK